MLIFVIFYSMRGGSRPGVLIQSSFQVNYGPFAHRLTDWPQTSLLLIL